MVIHTRQLIVQGLLLLLLSSCTAHSSGYYTQSVESWRGGSAKSLIRVWGTPDSTIKDTRGNTEYIYKRQRSFKADTQYSPSIGINSKFAGTPIVTAMPNANTPSDSGLTTICLTIFTANTHDEIIDTRIDGTNCDPNTSALANPASRGPH